MKKDGNQLNRLAPKPPISKPVQQPQLSLLELNLMHHVKDKDWSAKKKLLDDPWS